VRFNDPHEALRYHVSGAVYRGEKEAITEMPTEELRLIRALPELPGLIDACDTDETCVELVLFRERLADANAHLGYVTRADAVAYCDREDTHGTDDSGNGWFAGWRSL
jgi:hypothetical protein